MCPLVCRIPAHPKRSRWTCDSHHLTATACSESSQSQFSKVYIIPLSSWRLYGMLCCCCQPAQTNWAIWRVNGIHGSRVRSALVVLFCAWGGSCSTGSAGRGACDGSPRVNKQHLSTLLSELPKEQLVFHPPGTADLSLNSPVLIRGFPVVAASPPLYLEALE